MVRQAPNSHPRKEEQLQREPVQAGERRGARLAPALDEHVAVHVLRLAQPGQALLQRAEQGAVTHAREPPKVDLEVEGVVVGAAAVATVAVVLAAAVAVVVVIGVAVAVQLKLNF